MGLWEHVARAFGWLRLGVFVACFRHVGMLSLCRLLVCEEKWTRRYSGHKCIFYVVYSCKSDAMSIMRYSIATATLS